MRKKMLRRSLALGALMAFAITGSALAANYNHSYFTGDIANGFEINTKMDHGEHEFGGKKDNCYGIGTYYTNGQKVIDNEVIYTFTINASDTYKTNSGISGLEINSNTADLTFNKSVGISVSTDLTGTGNNSINGLAMDNGKITFNDNLLVDVTTTNENGKAAYGISAGGNTLTSFNGSFVDININTATTRNEQKIRTEAMGLTTYDKESKIIASENTVVNIDVIGSDTGDFASPVYGIVAEMGTIDIKGTADIYVETQGSSVNFLYKDPPVDKKDDYTSGGILNGDYFGYAVGIKAIDGYSNSSATEEGVAKVTIKNAKVIANATNGKAIGIFSTDFDGTAANVTMITVEGDLSVEATGLDASGVEVLKGTKTSLGNVDSNISIYAVATGENKTAYSLYAQDGGNLDIFGKTVSLTGDVLVDQGTITLQGSDNTVNGVITSTNNGEVNLTGENATYNVQHMEADGGTINVGAGTTIVVNSSNVTDGKYLVTVSDDDSLVVGKDAKIKIIEAKKGQDFHIVDGSNDEYWKPQDISTDNFMLECVKKENSPDYILTTQVADAKEVFGGAVLISDVLTQTMKKKDAGDAAFDFFNAAADEKVNATNAQAAKAINNAASMSELAGVSHATYSASNILTDAVADHMSLAKNLDHDTDIWAHYVHNKENIDGLASGNSGAKYDAQYNGLVVGADLYKHGKGTLGAALTYIDGKITGSTRNEAEYYGLSIYGGIENEDSAVIGDISYLHGKNDITQNNSGYVLTGEPKSDALSVGVRAEQSFKAGAGKVVPYAGLRYMHLGTGNYTNSIGLQYDADDANLFLLPVGVKYSAEHKTAGWTLRPIVEVGYVWAMGDRDGQQTVSLNGASNGFGYDVTDSGSYIGRFALEAEKANVTYGLGYEYQKGDSVKANKWMVNLNWAF